MLTIHDIKIGVVQQDTWFNDRVITAAIQSWEHRKWIFQGREYELGDSNTYKSKAMRGISVTKD